MQSFKADPITKIIIKKSRHTHTHKKATKKKSKLTAKSRIGESGRQTSFQRSEKHYPHGIIAAEENIEFFSVSPNSKLKCSLVNFQEEVTCIFQLL